MEAKRSAHPTPIIQMEDVAIGAMRDPETVVLGEIYWNVNDGEYWVIGGLQGSGKSDFVLATAGLMAPLRGRYLFLGEEMPIFDEARLPMRLKLGLVFETGQLFNHLTVRQNVALPLRYHRNLTMEQAQSEVQPVLEALELAPWADSTPGALGRNWQKRVGLARALMLKPELLIVDNPLIGLDLRHTNWWLGFLEELSRGHNLFEKRALTLVVTTADLRPWQGRAPQFAILQDKRMHILGSWSQVEGAGQQAARELLAL
jgi:phospholipid/cholesterol/gamma-HCH transport system ATP-binding protein